MIADVSGINNSEYLKLSFKGKIMSIEKRLEATAKNIEGKVQEVIGEVTGNPEDKIEGQAKQAEAQVIHITENIKDKVKDVLK
jgi:uncharacterized protein YjbJ (UPF0337 family)